MMSALPTATADATVRSPLLEVHGLVRHFRKRRNNPFAPPTVVRAVDDISFSIASGETLGLVGESGCGKSTTGRIVLGIDEPTSGSVRFEGRPVTGLPPREWRAARQDLQMIFQDPMGALDPRMTVARQIMEPLAIHDIGSLEERETRMLEMLQAVGLPGPVRTRYPHELSGGQLQRVVIARALILRPKLIVCDEPVSALDVSVQAQVVNLLVRLQREFGLTYLFISHDLKIVRHVSHRVAVMYLGQVVETAERDELFDAPLHPYTQALISAIPVPDPTKKRPRIVLTGDPPSPVNPPAGCRFHTRCPFARPICKEEPPVFRPVTPARRVACHFAGTRMMEA